VALKVLIADDSSLFRKVLTDILSSIPDVEVAGTAPNGRLALQKIKELKPDLLTLDMEMPEMDGLEVLNAIKKGNENLEVIVVSALTHRGGDLTMKALEAGAFDFITKPDTNSPIDSKASITKDLVPRIKALSHRLEIRNILKSKPLTTESKTIAATKPALQKTATSIITAGMNSKPVTGRPEMLLIGISTGGPNALSQMLPQLPANINVPIFIVQHMPPVFTQSLAESLSLKCSLKIKEAENGEIAKPNVVYIAPGGKQMRVVPSPEYTLVIQITDDPPENNCKPAVDYLFRSISKGYPGKAMAIIMTGMGSDGTTGLRLLKRTGCYIIAQDEASCVVYGMPKAAVDAGITDIILPLDKIASHTLNVIRGFVR
jgi:two-component system chemotaxis response regulator CheB